MKKRVACFVAALLCAAPLAYAAPAPSAPEPEPITLVTYEGLETLVTESNENYQSLLKNIRAIEISIQDMKDQHEQVVKLPISMGSESAIGLQGNIKAMEDTLEETRDKCGDTAAQLTFQAQTLYWMHYMNSLDLQIAKRSLSALEEDLPAYRQKQSLGLISLSALESYEKSIKTGRDTVKASQTKVDDNLKELAKYLGISTKISLDGAPKIDLGRILDRDLEADRAAYTLSAPDVVAKEKEKKSKSDAYAKSNSAYDSYNYTVAKENYEAAKEKAARDFDDVYQKLYDSYDSYSSSTLVSDAQETLDKIRAQVREGILAPNRAAAEQRNYLTAVDQYEKQRIGLWLELLQYEYNLIHWDI